MKPATYFLLVCVLLLGACYTPREKKPYYDKENDLFTLSGICYMRADEQRLASQSADEMRESGKIPSVNFEFDSIVLVPSSYDTLDKLASIMKSNRSYKLIVEGHTDEVGSDEYNDWLSAARANAVKSYLISRDVYSDSIKTYGHGKRMPLVKDDSPDGRACNRRIKFILTTRDWATVF